MDRFRKFTVDIVAIVSELSRSSKATEKGMVPVDARLFNNAVQIAGRCRNTFNHHLEGSLRMEVKRLQKRFTIDPEPASEPPKETKDEPENATADA